ncbi:MAG: hypothetical protein K1X36_06540 [Pyrinomonadaceae bacterium]|nr:hypothetical protein [Pyrinomonadaceae bacterium]
MTETFDCASCSAPLDFEGKHVQKCKFCGSTVIVPPELIRAAAGYSDRSSRVELDLSEILQLIAGGKKIFAIKLFRETFDVGLKEAKDAVDSIESGRGVDLSSMQSPAGLNGPSANTPQGIGKLGLSMVKPILGIIGLIFLVTALLVAVILYFAFRTVDRALDNAANTITRPNTDKASGVSEVLKFGGSGIGPGRFTDNRHIGVDSGGTIYSAEYQGGRIQSFDPSGKFVSQWSAGEDVIVRDMAVSRDGVVYILDTKGISAFEGSTGKLLQRADRRELTALSVMIDGRVVGAGRKGIEILSKSLEIITERKDAAKLASALSGFDLTAVDGLDNIYAVDRRNGEICKFASDGRFLTRIATGISSPNDIAIDPKGRLFVSETSKITAIDDKGLPLRTFPVTQAFGFVFNDAGDLLIASRPFVIKYSLAF